MKVRLLIILSVLELFITCSNRGGNKDPLIDPSHAEWRTVAPHFYRVQISSSKGDFIIDVTRAWAPKGADRFYNLVRLGFFDDSRFYRVRKDFIMQFGIAGKPLVAQVWEKNEITDDSVVESNKRGFIAYAMTGPDTRTTQLYINLVDNERLDDQGFAPIGFVSKGMEVVDSIYSGYDEAAGGGMRGGKQQKLFEQGNAYLDKEFPELDKLFKAEIIK